MDQITPRDYQPFRYSQELKFRINQSIVTHLVALLMFSMKPFNPTVKDITNGKLGSNLEFTWDNLPYKNMTFHWFSTATTY